MGTVKQLWPEVIEHWTINMMMIMWLHCSLTYCCWKWSGHKFWFQSKQPL